MAEPDPYAVLRLSKTFTLEELRGNYKKLALQLHPDKNVVSAEHASEVFKILTSCYKRLLHVHQLRHSDRQFTELKTSFNDSASPSVTPQPQPQEQAFRKDDGHFDPSRFNKFFSEHMVQDPAHDNGYGDWLAGKRLGEGTRRSRADADPPRECKSLLLHIDTMTLGRSKLNYSEMGVDAVDDYSLSGGCRKAVAATDLRVAYSEPRDDEPEASARKTYRNIDDLEKDRAGISFDMNDTDSQAYDKYKNWQATRESMQQSHIRNHDKQIEDNFSRVQRLLTTGQARA